MPALDVILIAVCVDNQSRKNDRVLVFTPNSDDIGLPTKDLGDASSLDEVGNIMYDLMGFRPRTGSVGELSVDLLGIYDSPRRETISIVYGCTVFDDVVPYDGIAKRSPYGTSSWRNLDEVMASPMFSDHKQILADSLAKI